MVVAFSLTAALCFALASVLQHRAAVAAPAQQNLRLGLLVHLIARPIWLAGIAADALGYLLQVLALDKGALAVVQPLLAVGLLFALIFNVSPGRRGLRPRDWLAALLIAAGITAFVVAGDPKGSTEGIDPAGWAVFTAATGAAVLTLVLLARRLEGSARAALIATSAGVAFGLSAALTKQSIAEFHRGFVNMLATGYPWTLLVAASVGMVLAQSAFQSGALAASLPALTLSEPLFAASTGVAVFDEHLRGGWRGVGAAIGAGVACMAVVAITRSPRAMNTAEFAAP